MTLLISLFSRFEGVMDFTHETCPEKKVQKMWCLAKTNRIMYLSKAFDCFFNKSSFAYTFIIQTSSFPIFNSMLNLLSFNHDISIRLHNTHSRSHILQLLPGFRPWKYTSKSPHFQSFLALQYNLHSLPNVIYTGWYFHQILRAL